MGVEEIAYRDEYGFVERLGLPSEPMIVDLGANIGLFALCMFNRRPQARIASVEASRSTFELLERNQREAAGLHWTVHHGAVWMEDGSIEFVDEACSTGSHIGTSPGEGRSVVPSLRLATFLSRLGVDRFDLLKMDIEGAEEAVLAADRSELRRLRNLIVEVHPETSSLPVVLDILRAEFPVVRRIGDRACARPLLVAARDPITIGEPIHP